jgi:hypothetical protein
MAARHGRAGRQLLVVSTLALLVVAVAPVAAQIKPPAGRVMVTVTTLEGAVHLPGVTVELRRVGETQTIARSLTDGAGQVEFPEIPPGEYVATASRPGFVARDSTPFAVVANETAQVLLDTQLGLVLPDVQVRAETPSPTDSVQPVSISDMLSGSIFESAPLQGDDFQSLLPLLPGVVRDNDGRLRIRGGQPTQSALQVSSVSLIDPSTGDFDLDLPAQSVASVEVLPNPFAAEYGRFSTSITQIRTRRGTNDWEFSTGNLMPRFRGMLKGIRAFEPRFSIRGPLSRDRLFISQDLQFRYVVTPVRSLPDEPVIDLRSFDSFTRLDHLRSARHSLGGGIILFPREIRRGTMNTFRPPSATPDFEQTGWTVGGVDRFAILPNLVVESALSLRRFEIDVYSRDVSAMVYAPESQSGGFFNDQERDVTSAQWVESLSLTRRFWQGEHVIKVGTDLQVSTYDGRFQSRPLEIRRLDSTLAESIVFDAGGEQNVSGVEFAVFAQDRWRLNGRVTFEFGLRVDRDVVVQQHNWSPRAGAAVSVLPEGRGILRGGFGKFVQRTPLNVEAFPTFPSRTVIRFADDGRTPVLSYALANRIDYPLQTPEAYVGNLEWDQRFGRRFLLKVAALARRGTHEYILRPDAATGALRLSSSGTSRYRELETTLRYLGGDRRDLTLSYVRAHGTADLNQYDQFYGNIPWPIVRANEHGLTATDVPHRFLLRGTIGLPGQWDLAPVVELRSGFPWSAVNEFQDFVGPRNRAGRLPAVRTLDFTLARPWKLLKYRFRAGIKVYNLFGAGAERDMQTNLASPSFGRAFNPVERSIGIVLGSVR